MGVGEYFGELGPLLGFPRSATARALTAGVLARLQRRRLPGAGGRRHRRRRRRLSRYSKSIAAKSLSLVSWWRAFTRRTVPDFERITRDWVDAPRLS